MNHSPKIQTSHLERKAYVYIRQSSLRQVSENLESQDLQYQLGDRAERLGWRAEQIEVIDDDLGKSGVSSGERQGFQSLVAAVGYSAQGKSLESQGLGRRKPPRKRLRSSRRTRQRVLPGCA